MTETQKVSSVFTFRVAKNEIDMFIVTIGSDKDCEASGRGVEFDVCHVESISMYKRFY